MYCIESDGMLNVFAAKFRGKHMVVVYSEALFTYNNDSIQDDEEATFSEFQTTELYDAILISVYDTLEALIAKGAEIECITSRSASHTKSKESIKEDDEYRCIIYV